MRHEVLDKVQDPRLRVYVVWIPMIDGDDSDFAGDASEGWGDPRVRFFWDGERAIGRVFGTVLGYSTSFSAALIGEHGSVAWDVYLAYPRRVRWKGGDPPAPHFWMQQLGLPAVPVLDGARLREETSHLLQPER